MVVGPHRSVRRILSHPRERARNAARRGRLSSGSGAEWLRLGRFPTRVGFYESMPQQAELLFTFAYALGGPTAAKFVHWDSSPLSSLFWRKWPDALRAVLVAASPVVMIDGTSAYNDVMLAFYALYLPCSAVGLDRTRRSSRRRRIRRENDRRRVRCGRVRMAVRAAKRMVAICRRGVGLSTPWLIRNALLAQNPFAPLFNVWFPNEHFHVSTEALLRENLSTQRARTGPSAASVVRWRHTWRTHRRRLRICSSCPLGLPKDRDARLHNSRAGGSTPWLANAGTRFLIPTLPFITLALPPPIALPAAILQVATLPWKTSPGSWQLEGWRARAEPSNLASCGCSPNILARANASSILSPRPCPGSTRHRSRPGATSPPTALLPHLCWRTMPRRDCSILFEPTGSPLRRSLKLVPRPRRRRRFGCRRLTGRSADCVLTATPYLRTPLAFDRSLITGWSSWAPARSGEAVTVTCPQAVETSGVSVTLAYVWPGMRLRIEGDGTLLNGDPVFTPIAPS